MSTEEIFEHDQQPDDERWAKAERMLAEIQPGWTLSIHRVRPSWCSGFLERLEISEDEPIDVDYIVNTWGGELLRLRLCDETGTYRRGAQLNLRSYPPLFRGQELSRHEPIGTSKKISGASGGETVVITQPTQTHVQPDLVELLGLVQKTRKDDLGLLRALLGSVQPQPPPPSPPPPHNSLDDLINFASKFRQLQDIFGTTAQPVSDDLSLLGTITDVIRTLQPTGQSRESRGHIKPPHMPQQNPTPTQPRTNVTSDNTDNDLPAVLAELNPQKFSEILLTALQRMSQDKREQAFAIFIEKSGLNESFDEDEDDEEEDS